MSVSDAKNVGDEADGGVVADKFIFDMKEGIVIFC